MKETIEKQIEVLEASLTGNFMTDLDIKDEIHTLKMKQKGVSCEFGSGGEDCEACGS
jgi:hypothetical protein